MSKGRILTVGHKPDTPAWRGIGDFDVVWDWQQSRWFMMTSKMRGAVSNHKSAAAQTWRKWNGTHFSVSNFVEDGARFKDTNNQFLPNGEHPSISWNRCVDNKEGCDTFRSKIK